MKLLFDVAELAPGMGKSMGIYNYAKGLLTHLIPILPSGWELHVMCNAGGRADFEVQHPQIHVHTVLEQRKPSAFQRQWWMRVGAHRMARQLGLDAYFTPKGFLPGWWGRPAGLKTVAVLHDLIPLWYEVHHPRQFSRLERWVVNAALRRTARLSDELIVISQATADDVFRQTGRSRAQVHVVHNGVPQVTAAPISPVSGRYIFAMASELPHKNLKGVLAAYQRYRELVKQPLPLVLCGAANPSQPGVVAIRGLDDVTLHTYYAHADLFVFLSLIEGFGFPPLEAMSHGTAVVCSDVAALREVTRGQAVLVPPQDAHAVAVAMCDCLEREGHVDDVERAARRHVAEQYSWERCAAGVMDVLKRCDSGPR